MNQPVVRVFNREKHLIASTNSTFRLLKQIVRVFGHIIRVVVRATEQIVRVFGQIVRAFGPTVRTLEMPLATR